MDAPAQLPAILFVEDNDDDFFLVHRQLKKAGVKNPILRFGEAGEARQFLLDRLIQPGVAPCLLLVDIYLPGMSGLELLEWVKQHPAYRSTKVVMLSAGENGDDRRAAELGADVFLKKLPSLEMLERVIADVCAI